MDQDNRNLPLTVGDQAALVFYGIQFQTSSHCPDGLCFTEIVCGAKDLNESGVEIEVGREGK